MHRTFLVVALAAAVPNAHAQTTVSLPADRDNTLYETVVGDLSNGAGDWLFAGNNNNFDARRALLHFDLSSIPAGAQILSARVELTMDRTRSTALDIALHPLLADWGESDSNAGGQEGDGDFAAPGDATWTHAFLGGAEWESAGGDFDPEASASAFITFPGTYAWTGDQLTADVQSWVDGGADNYGWLLLADESFVPGSKRFRSREHPEVETRPRLVVDYVPAPGALSLLVTGIVASRRRR
jgi:hypothetical protein